MRVSTIAMCSTLVMMAFALSCSGVQEQELYGTYFAQYEFGTEKLILDSNGEYEQIIEITLTSESFQKRGKWHYIPKFSEIELSDAYTVQDGFGHLDNSYYIPSVGRVLIGIDRLFPWNNIKLGSDELVQMEKLPDQKTDAAQ